MSESPEERLKRLEQEVSGEAPNDRLTRLESEVEQEAAASMPVGRGLTGVEEFQKLESDPEGQKEILKAAVVNPVSGAMRSVGIGAKFAGELLDVAIPTSPEKVAPGRFAPGTKAKFALGSPLKAAGEAVLGAAPEPVELGFPGDVLTGIGSTLPMLPAAFLGPAGVAGASILVESGAAYYSRLGKSPGDYDAAWRAAMLAAPAASLEAIPVMSIFGRAMGKVNKASGGKLWRAIQRIPPLPKEALGEYGQEFTQELSAVLEEHLSGEDIGDLKDILKRANYSGAVGLVAVTPLSLAASAVQGTRGQDTPTEAEGLSEGDTEALKAMGHDPREWRPLNEGEEVPEAGPDRPSVETISFEGQTLIREPVEELPEGAEAVEEPGLISKAVGAVKGLFAGKPAEEAPEVAEAPEEAPAVEASTEPGPAEGSFAEVKEVLRKRQERLTEIAALPLEGMAAARDELAAEERAVRERILGPEAAERWDMAERRGRSRILDEIESGLSEAEKDTLAGLDDPSPALKDVEDLIGAVEEAEAETGSEVDVAREAARLVRRMGGQRNPAEMSSSEREAYTAMRHLMQRAREEGYDMPAIGKSVGRAITQTYPDPSDTEFMLRTLMPELVQGGERLTTAKGQPELQAAAEVVITDLIFEAAAKSESTSISESAREDVVKEVESILSGGEAEGSQRLSLEGDVIANELPGNLLTWLEPFIEGIEQSGLPYDERYLIRLKNAAVDIRQAQMTDKNNPDLMAGATGFEVAGKALSSLQDLMGGDITSSEEETKRAWGQMFDYEGLSQGVAEAVNDLLGSIGRSRIKESGVRAKGPTRKGSRTSAGSAGLPSPRVLENAEVGEAAAPGEQEPEPTSIKNEVEAAAQPGEQEPEAVGAGVGPIKGLDFDLGTLAKEGGQSAKKFIQRNLTSRGDLPESVFREMVGRDARVKAENQEIAFAGRDFRRAARKVYGSPSRMNPGQVAAVDAAFKNPELVDSLPEPMRDPVTRMREHVDALSRALIDTGVVEGDLAARVDANLGFYATRSYRVFDDPDWAKKVPVEVRNKAKALFRKEYPDKSEDQIEGLIENLLYQGKAAQSPIALLSKSKLGAKDLSILSKRKDIAPEIRALFGEHESALVNYARSVSKMAHLIANHQFLGEVRASGLEEGFLTEEPTPSNIVQLASDESSVLSPLNGLYTTPEIETAFREAVEAEQMPDWLRYFLAANSVVKMSKTVGSVITHVRNFIGNLGFVTANGLWRPGKANEAFKSISTKFGLMNDREWQEYYKDALRHGVIHESARAGELRDIIRDAVDRDPSEVLSDQGRIDVMKPIRVLTDIYQSQDDFWKIYAWENEQARYGKAHPEWTTEQLKERTAEIVRNTFPTYSLVPRTIKKLRRFPVLGTFVSFPAEVIRTAGNTVALAKEELSAPETRAIGAQRAAGILLAATGTTAAAAASRFLVGLSADDDEDARVFFPPWSEDSDIIWLGRGEDGNWLWTDVGYTDPYSYLKEPVRAMLRGESWEEGLYTAMGRAMEPFLSEEIAFQAAREVMSNKTRSGRDVYNEAQSWTEQAESIVNHLWDAAEPGTISTARRIAKGLQGKVTTYGRAYDPKVEALAAMSGVRVNELDVVQALSFKASDYGRTMADATRVLTAVAGRRGDVSEAELRDAHSSMEASRVRAFEKMHKAIRAAIRLGVSRFDINATLNGSISNEKSSQLLSGKYGPYSPSGSFLSSQINRSDEAGRKDLLKRRNFIRSLSAEKREN